MGSVPLNRWGPEGLWRRPMAMPHCLVEVGSQSTSSATGARTLDWWWAPVFFFRTGICTVTLLRSQWKDEAACLSQSRSKATGSKEWSWKTCSVVRVSVRSFLGQSFQVAPWVCGEMHRNLWWGERRKAIFSKLPKLPDAPVLPTTPSLL